MRHVAHAHRAAGPLTAALADRGTIAAGCSTELLAYVETTPLGRHARSDVAALWEHVERAGVDGAQTLRQLDAERASCYRQLLARLDERAAS